MSRDTVQLETVVSTISQEYLLEFTSEYGITEDLHPKLPGPGERIVDFSEGKVGVYTKFFEFANFCLPLSQLLFDILGHYQIYLSQLSVMGATKVSHFEINCRVLNIVPTLSLFRVFYIPSFNSGSGSKSHHTTPNATEAFPILRTIFIRSVQPARTASTTRMIPGVCPAWSGLSCARRKFWMLTLGVAYASLGLVAGFVTVVTMGVVLAIAFILFRVLPVLGPTDGANLFIQKDTIQLETAVSTILQEYLLEFTSECGISEDLHPELPGPGERIVDFPEGKGIDIAGPFPEGPEIGMPTYRITSVDVLYNDEELRLNLYLLEERRERSAIREAKAKLKMTKYYNARVCGVTFRPCDFVYRSNDASHAVKGGKLRPKWEGPYEVTEALGDGAYKLRSTDGTVLPRTWNIANLKICYI
nr:reverse transcriptase domain-containing protein [Tanacetum cinerariifolium]